MSNTRYSRLKARIPQIFVIVLFILGLIAFFERGIFRVRNADIEVIYASAVVWRDGGDPYNSQQLKDTVQFNGRPEEEIKFISLYPPATYFLMLPLTLFDWPTAKYAWLGMNILCLGLFFWLSWSMMDLKQKPLWLPWLSLLLLFSPLHVCMFVGQISFVAMTLALAGFVMLKNKNDLLAAILIACATALKPHNGLGFVLFLLLSGNLRAFLVCCLTGLGILSIGICRLELAGVKWLDSWRGMVQTHTGSGVWGPMQQTTDWPHHYSLHSILHCMLDDTTVVSVLASLISFGLLGVVSWYTWRYRQQTTVDLLAIASISVITMLPLYHRNYDAVLLLFPLMWAFRSFDRKEFTSAWWIVSAGLTIFFLPNSAAMVRVFSHAYLPSSIQNHMLWRCFGILHFVWIMLTITMGLILAMRQRERGR